MSIYNAQCGFSPISPGLPSYAVSGGYVPGISGVSGYGSGTPSTSAKAYFGFFSPPVNATISALALYLFTGQTGAKARMGIYSNVNGYPSNLLADFGEISLSGSAGIVEAGGASLNVSPAQGGLWICTWMCNAATQASVAGAGAAPYVLPLTPAEIGVVNSARGYSSVQSYPASLPSSAPVVGIEATGSNGVPLPWVKVG